MSGLIEFRYQMEVFERRSEIRLICEMCAETVSCTNSSPHDIAEQAYCTHGWRVRDGEMLCGRCKER